MPLDVAYKTALGKLIHGKAEDALNSTALQKYHEK